MKVKKLESLLNENKSQQNKIIEEEKWNVVTVCWRVHC